MDDLKKLFDGFVDALEEAMQITGERVVASMRKHYHDHTHNPEVETGELLSDRSMYSKTVRDSDEINTYVYVSAKNPRGEPYAEFLEYGTGAKYGGRDTPWTYRAKDGNFYTTTGMDAKPFIDPAVQDVLTDLKDLFDDVIYGEDTVRKYKGGGST